MYIKRHEKLTTRPIEFQEHAVCNERPNLVLAKGSADND